MNSVCLMSMNFRVFSTQMLADVITRVLTDEWFDLRRDRLILMRLEQQVFVRVAQRSLCRLEGIKELALPLATVCKFSNESATVSSSFLCLSINDKTIVKWLLMRENTLLTILTMRRNGRQSVARIGSFPSDESFHPIFKFYVRQR